jgi:hypothetical protein
MLRYVEERMKRGPIPSSHWLLRLSSIAPPGGTPPSQGTKEGLDPQGGWYVRNKLILDFLETVPAERRFRVRGEDLLSDPDPILRHVAQWLDVRTDPEAIEAMKHPERSPFAFLGPPGARYGNDAFFLEDPVFRPAKMPALQVDGPLPWRTDGQGLAPSVKELATQLGY